MTRGSGGARIFAVIALLGLTSASAVAVADSAKPPTKASIDEAQRRFQRGRELYDENDFQAALVEFRRAYELAPNFRLLYDIAQVYYQLQDYPGSLRTFNKYLSDGQGDVPAQRREEVQKEIERLHTRVASVSVTVNKAQAEIAVDDVPVGKAPLSEPVVVSVGRRKISATLPGFAPATKVVEVAGMDAVQVNLEINETSAGRAGASGKPDDAGKDARAQASQRRGVPWVGFAITGGLGVAAAITGGLALRASGDLDTKLATLGSTRADLDGARSTTKTLALTTDILLGATVVAAGVSLVLTLTRGPEKADHKGSSPPAVRLGFGPRSVGVSGAF